MLSSDNELYATFYQLVEAWAPLPEDNEWDRGRSSVDSLLFPNYPQRNPVAAGFSLNGQGMVGYGGLTMVLSDVKIQTRTTVFEKNSMQFCRDHQVIAGGPVPLGFKAEWVDRGTLAAAKLHGNIGPDTTEDQFTGILMDHTGATTADFIEVQYPWPDP